MITRFSQTDALSCPSEGENKDDDDLDVHCSKSVLKRPLRTTVLYFYLLQLALETFASCF